MKKCGVLLTFVAGSLLAFQVVAAGMDGVMMKDGKMITMKDGKSTGPMHQDMLTTNGHKVMPDGTMKMPDGKEMRMKEGQMMAMDGKMMEGGKAMKMEGMK